MKSVKNQIWFKIWDQISTEHRRQVAGKAAYNVYRNLRNEIHNAAWNQCRGLVLEEVSIKK